MNCVTYTRGGWGSDSELCYIHKGWVGSDSELCVTYTRGGWGVTVNCVLHTQGVGGGVTVNCVLHTQGVGGE